MEQLLAQAPTLVAFSTPKKRLEVPGGRRANGIGRSVFLGDSPALGRPRRLVGYV